MARRTLSRLTAQEVKTLSNKPGRHADGGGLYLQVSPGGVASWTYRFMVDGRERNMGLGPLHSVTLKEARERASAARRMRHAEVPLDPLAERQANRMAAKVATAKTMTFEECARAYIAAHRAGWKSAKHAAQWAATLETYVFPVFGKLPVAAIDTALVMQALQPIWTEKPETASRVRGRIEAVLDWATVSEFRQGDNPARWKGHLEHKLAAKSKVRAVVHLPALPYVEIPAFMAELRKQEGIAARALEFTILCAARTGETLGATWAEFDLANRLWTLAPQRMKAGREHRVALSDRAVTIVEELAAVRSSDFVFPGAGGTKPLNSMAMVFVLRRMGRDDVVVHGMRATFADWTTEQTSFSTEAREMALAHSVGDKVTAAYRRTDLFETRRLLAQAWARFCAGGDVVPLRVAG